MQGKPSISIVKNISVLRGLAIALVVYAHSQRSIIGVIRNQSSNASAPYSWLDYVTVMLSATVGSLPVPSFMVASGFFMARFTNNWASASASARTLATRYAIWSFAGFVFLVAQHPSNWKDIGVSTLLGFGPFPAYWFLAVVLFALLLAPWLSRWAKGNRGSFLMAAIGLEIARGVVYNLQWNSFRWLPLELPFFMLGIVLSQNTEAIVKKLSPHRRWLGVVSLLGFVVVVLESTYWWHVDGGPSLRVITDARISVRAWSSIFVAWFLLAPTGPATKISRFLNDVGVKSLAILLSFEAILEIAVVGFWHLPMLTGGWDPALKAPPVWMANGLFSFVLFSVSGGGSLLAVWAVERLFGVRWRRTVFG